MTRLLAVALLVTAACKPESARRADRAADEVLAERKDVVEAAKKLPDKPLAEGATELFEEAGELSQAAREFDRQKSRRLALLLQTHDLTSTQTGVISVLARDMQITDAARSEINEKLTRLQRRLDETANLIEGLSSVQIDAWEERDIAVTDAMKRLEDARKSAWDAVDDAPHIRSSAVVNAGPGRVSVLGDGQAARVQRHTRRAH